MTIPSEDRKSMTVYLQAGECLRLDRREVRGGQSTPLQFPMAFAGCAIDVAYRMPENNLMRGGVWLRWTEFHAAGTGLAWVNADAEGGPVAIDRVRACGRAWMPSQASFVVVP